MPDLPGKSCRVPRCPGIAKAGGNGYCEAHKNKGWEDFQRQQNKRIYQTREWESLRKMCFEVDQHRCRPCREKGIVKHGHICDHIKPISQGGTNDLSNLQTICDECHKRKTATERKLANSK